MSCHIKAQWQGGFGLKGMKGERKKGRQQGEWLACQLLCKVELPATPFWINVLENLSVQGQLHKHATY